MKKSHFLIISSIILFFVLIILSIGFWNRSQIRPTAAEIKIMNDFYGDIRIKTDSDIIRIQNFTLKEIKHEFIGSKNINIAEILSTKKGFCFDRSLLLQKVMIHNGIEVRPVYIFFYESGNKVSSIDFFNNDINSHNVFEFKWKGKWYMMRTNTPMNNFITLEDYISTVGFVPYNSRYVRYLNNRNGKFIYPAWIPDFYW